MKLAEVSLNDKYEVEPGPIYLTGSQALVRLAFMLGVRDKAAGLDRSLDALSHANLCGTSKYGGVLVLTGDDHGMRSTDTPAHCEPTYEGLMMPLKTAYGNKRMIDQSSCNKDFSCVEGFCPSFVTVLGGKPRKGKGIGEVPAALQQRPEPILASIPAEGTYNILVCRFKRAHQDHSWRLRNMIALNFINYSTGGYIYVDQTCLHRSTPWF